MKSLSAIILALVVLPAWGQMPYLPETDLQRFPPCEIASEMEVFSARYQDILRSRILWGGPQVAEYWQELYDTQTAGLAWHNLRMAWQSEQAHGWYLNELANTIGHDAYMTGQMPPPVPVWRFRRIL